MSRIGKRPVSIPQGVKVEIKGASLCVEGPKGKLDFQVHPRMKVSVGNGQVSVERPTNTPQDRSLHGMTRSVINNMIAGVSQEFTKTLEVEGIGFKGQIQGKNLQLSLGFSHPVDFPIPAGVKVETPKPTIVTVKGSDKALVGQVAANIRRFFEPEPYKGKGIHYSGEQIRRKAGKAAGK
jgi:large subunit ribosomal protein L6